MPQIFITWTVDLTSPAFCGTLGSVNAGLKDVALFCIAFRNEWHRVWTYIHKVWAKKVVGGVHEFAWVLEYQERGTPHIHMVLWTGKSLQELIEQNNRGGRETVVTCSRHHPDARVRVLVEWCQVHRHSEDYCMRTKQNGERQCRFGFEQSPCSETKVEGGRVVYKRESSDGMVNAYNPELLSIFGTNMDIQINYGKEALFYLSKYISKPSNVRTGAMEGNKLCK